MEVFIMDLQKESYYVTSTFCFELFGMSQERQLKKLQAVFWPADKLNRSWYPFLFFVKHFSLKKASEFPVFSEGFSLL